MKGAYYNELDRYAAQWLRNLIAAGHIAAGDVDERSIVDVRPDDLRGYTQCHWFAGIGGWSYALRLAGWCDERPVWTGSCPCQPFSAAGKRQGFADKRHLWPEWYRLIRECHPETIFGEQVASKAVLPWFDLVSTDLEREDYAVEAADICAAGVGAPHIRQRLWYVAYDTKSGRKPWRRSGEASDAGELAHANGGNASAEWLQRGGEHRQFTQDSRLGKSPVEYTESEQVGVPGCPWEPRTTIDGMGNAPGERLPSEPQGWVRGGLSDGFRQSGEVGKLADTNSPSGERLGRISIPMESEQETRRSSNANPWAACEFIECADGKARPVEPGTFPLAHGIPNRLGRLRAYGNAIIPQVAAQFIGAFMDCRP
jgi:DNA (cytosine-5)-methyltransferase 1